MMWRDHKIPLIVIAVLLIGNIFFFFTYRVQYQSRLGDLDTRQADAQRRLQEAQRSRSAAEQQLASYDKVRADLQNLYDERWSTQTRRFTLLFEEVKRLATASRFDPRSFNFSRTESTQSVNKETGIGSTAVSVSFTVQGTYEQVRRLINLLELSDQFIIIDGLGLAGGSDTKMLTMNIRLKTLFRDPASSSTGRPNQQM
ncbi:MAG: GspMb/PilO family protein [Acidobacteriota bacterium]